MFDGRHRKRTPQKNLGIKIKSSVCCRLAKKKATLLKKENVFVKSCALCGGGEGGAGSAAFLAIGKSNDSGHVYLVLLGGCSS